MTSSQGILSNSDGFTQSGGITTRTFQVTSGNVEIIAAGAAAVYTYPPASDTLAGLGTTETFTATQSFSNTINSTIPQTTLFGTTSGSVIWSQPFAGASYKKFVGYVNGYENNTATNQTITYPTAFTNAPAIIYNGSGLTISTTASVLTITAPNNTTTFTGNIIVEGY